MELMLSRRSILLAAPTLIIPNKLFARASPASAPDPGHIFYEQPGLAAPIGSGTGLIYNDITGKTPRSLAINGSIKTLVMICVGQSLQTDLITDTFTPTNGSVLDNFCWYNGACYAATTPLMGTAWNGSIATSVNYNHKVADGLISNGKFDRVIIIPINIPGTDINIWANDGVIAEATGYYRCIIAAALKLAAVGITPSTTGVKFLIKWNQGENDTVETTTQAAYTNSFNQMKSKVDAVLPVKWTVARETWILGNTSATVQAAQAAVVDNVTVFGGENMDSMNATNRVADNTHLNATGGNTAAAMGIAAITAITF
jgi:hypothetical protein